MLKYNSIINHTNRVLGNFYEKKATIAGYKSRVYYFQQKFIEIQTNKIVFLNTSIWINETQDKFMNSNLLCV